MAMRGLYCLASCILAFVLSGCLTQRMVQVGARTPAAFGDLKVYGTANVPFEYEEVAVLAQGYNMGHYTEEACFKMFAEKAREVKADAVLNFKMEIVPGVGGFLFVMTAINPTSSCMTLSGVAVKIKRP